MAKRKTAKKKASKATNPAKSASPKKKASRHSKAGDEPVTLDRRRPSDRRKKKKETPTTSAPPQLERRAKVARRRQIDPTTCERDYSTAEVEFMNALSDYKRKSGRMFPTCSEVLEVIRSLGYVQLGPAERLANLPGEALGAEQPLLDPEASEASDLLEVDSIAEENSLPVEATI